MQRTSIRIGGSLEGLLSFVGGVAKVIRGLALVTVVAVAAIASVLARGGLEAAEIVVALVLLVPPAVLLFFSAGLNELMRLPERLRRMPGQGSENLAQLRSIAGEMRHAGVRRAPSLLWRLRGVVGSSRDLVGFALPLRVFTPAFLGFTAMAAFFCLILIGAGFIALIVLALG
jgi:hypothetical protein